ncbi:protein BRANCHLESS TRICHOME [Andrographis paniculata]|uniref:protein BRANCHLESS TRICHOME n=1 Tax=Andrographis paniculata TaxID=175694 RepID=UPI0021E70812|nr:protein BRANCHLESS TRICHOME [Andrographis paniculata]
MADMMTMQQQLMINIRQTTHPITNINNESYYHCCCNNLHPPVCKPTWKLYENPFYAASNQKPPLQPLGGAADRKIHRLHLPVSARKLAASFWDLDFIKPPDMLSESDKARAQILELKNILETERKARRKIEGLNKKLATELMEERKSRKALEKRCEDLANKISSDKLEISRMRREFEEERKMLRTAEVIREERVQMKLAEAKILLEEKFSEIDISGDVGSRRRPESMADRSDIVDGGGGYRQTSMLRGKLRLVLGEKKKTAATENPHIRRGIKGFVEFPKVVKAIGCRRKDSLGSKLECPRAQLKILLKRNGTVPIKDFIITK